MRGITLGSLVFGVLLAGCGDDGATEGQFAAYCAARCDWKERCGNGSSDCVNGCEAEGQSLFAQVRSAAVVAIRDCFAAKQDCGSDDACFVEGVRAVAPALMDDPKYKACEAARSSCSETSFSDDYCASMLILVSSAQAEFEACYDRPCDQMRDCVRGVLGEGTDDRASR